MNKKELNINSRRTFLKTGLACGASTILFPNTISGINDSHENLRNGSFREPARSFDVNREFDVIICGGGPAGVSAAISSARSGAKTLLIEKNGCLGGIWTAGLLSWIFDFDKPGFNKELIAALDARNARRGTNPKDFVYEPDQMKYVLEEKCAEANVDVLYFTQIVAAYKEGKNISAIITESKAGRKAWSAPVFIDATGDGDLGYYSGCEWEIGKDGGTECPCQPLTFNALAIVEDADKIGDCISFYSGRNYDGHVEQTEHFLAEIHKAGIEPSYAMPTLFQVWKNLVLVMVNHEYEIKPYDTKAMTKATIRARKEVFHIVDGLNKLGGRWNDMRIVASAEEIGIREGRRIHGRYKVKREDLINGARHEDAVTRATFGVDIHASDKDTDQKEKISHGGFRTLPYDIPLRALIAKDVDNLMMAGRCISGDFIAHASYRVTGNSVGLGEGAGVVAALAARKKVAPYKVKWEEAKTILETKVWKVK
ncbi:MAG: FAD-dependent oxidoreductase [Tannerella sp.]|jgi:hypothetical protein|nr:FAD-dependent oxidoreductase [Tannerella sp.]